MSQEVQTYHGKCHCGCVQFTVQLSEALHSARRCTCSYCRMRGAVAVSANLDGITFLSGEDTLNCYQFNSKTAKHYFCSQCGIYTHHQRRSNPNEFGINVACLEGISPFDFEEVVVYDGANHHPSESKSGSKIAGILRFEQS